MVKHFAGVVEELLAEMSDEKPEKKPESSGCYVYCVVLVMNQYKWEQQIEFDYWC